MAVQLEGGCRVTGLSEGAPIQSETLTIRHQIDRSTGARAISLRIVEALPGLSPGMVSGSADAALYVRSGKGSAWLDGREYPLKPDTGLFVRSGANLTLRCGGEEPLILVGARRLDPGEPATFTEPLMKPGNRSDEASAVPRRKTAGHRCCELVDPEVGSREITQFVGSIPPGRAPDHFHRYEEVLFSPSVRYAPEPEGS